MTLTRVQRDTRGTSTASHDLQVYGVIKNYAPQDLVGDVIQGDSILTISNAEIAAADDGFGPPKAGDKIVIDGRIRNIRAVESKYLSTDVLVHVCQVRG